MAVLSPHYTACVPAMNCVFCGKWSASSLIVCRNCNLSYCADCQIGKKCRSCNSMSCGTIGAAREAAVKAVNEASRCQYEAHGSRCERTATHQMPNTAGGKKVCARCAASAFGVLFLDPLEYPDQVSNTVERFGAKRI